MKKITIIEAEQITGIESSTIRKMCDKGEIEGTEKVGGRIWTLPYEWAHARRVDPDDYEGYMPLAKAALLADVTREAMRKAAERGAVVAKKRLINKRNSWWINVSDQSFFDYIAAARERSARYDDAHGAPLSFSDYLKDREIIVPEPALKHLKVLWDIHGDDYKAHCAEHNYDGEDLDRC